jgi:predicted unusual protein kinase regulating ubiquinone biosynthesis (AarF/ABC1/UbiB family)
MKQKRSSPTRRALQMARLGLNVGGSYLGYVLQRAFLNEEKRRTKLRSANQRAAQRMRGELESLRGPAMKLGQTLSLQGGVLPEEVLLELSKLQMEAPGMHPSLMRAQFRGSMGRDPEEVFRSFTPEPFAAASLGQVHRAVTREGEPVAVKIQYPGIRDAIAHDFAWFRTVSRPAQVTGHVPKATIDELEAQIVAETDYLREADNLEFFEARLAPLGFVSVPRVHREYSTDQVLTMALARGDHLDAFLRSRPSQRERDLIGEHLVELFYYQILRLEAFHADPNAGNYFFKRDGTITLVDFGCVKHLSAAFVADLRSLYLYHGARDSEHFQSLLEKRYALFGAKLRPGTRKALVSFAENFFRKVYPPEVESDDRAFDFGKHAVVKEYLRESEKLLKTKGALPEYTFLARADLGLYHMLQRLGARVHTSRIVRKHLQSP